MSIGRATIYGVAALVYLARRKSAHPATVQEISEATGMPVEYLRKLLSRLINQGLIRSVRGRRGGFLAVPSATPITLLDVHEAMEGPMDAQSVFDRDLLQYLDGPGADKLDRWREQTAGVLRDQMRAAQIDALID